MDASLKAVVVVVSGRPLVLTDQLGKMDALVASWLPGSQGEGVGDRDYHPLFPYGFGLRTSVH